MKPRSEAERLEWQAKDRRRREARRGAPGPQPKTKPEGRTKLLGAGGAPIETPPRNAQGGQQPASGGFRGSPDLRTNPRQADGEKPWAYGAGRCRICGAPPIRGDDGSLACADCGWKFRFDRGLGKWVPQQ